MLDKDSVLDANNVRCNPVHRGAEAAESPVHNHEVSLCQDRSRLILERWRKTLDEIEQPFTTRRDMSTMLDVMR